MQRQIQRQRQIKGKPDKPMIENIFLKFINDSRKHVGLNPLPRAHYYPAQPDHLQPRQVEDFQRRFERPGYKLQIGIHRILVTRRKIYDYYKR